MVIGVGRDDVVIYGGKTFLWWHTGRKASSGLFDFILLFTVKWGVKLVYLAH